MRSRRKRLGAAVGSLCALALFVPSFASANHVPYPVVGVGGAAVGHTTTPSFAATTCIPTARITATPSIGGKSTVKAWATSYCRGTLGLRRAYFVVKVFKGSQQIGNPRICYWTEHADGTPYPANQTYDCPWPPMKSSGTVFRVETSQAYRLYDGSWIAAGECVTPTYEGATGAVCKVGAVTAG